MIVAACDISYSIYRFHFFWLAFFVEICRTFIFWVAKPTITATTPSINTTVNCQHRIVNAATYHFSYITQD